MKDVTPPPPQYSCNSFISSSAFPQPNFHGTASLCHPTSLPSLPRPILVYCPPVLSETCDTLPTSICSDGLANYATAPSLCCCTRFFFFHSCSPPLSRAHPLFRLLPRVIRPGILPYEGLGWLACRTSSFFSTMRLHWKPVR